MPCRRMQEDDKDFTIACAVPVDAEGITIVARPAGRPENPAAKMSANLLRPLVWRILIMYSCLTIKCL